MSEQDPAGDSQQYLRAYQRNVLQALLEYADADQQLRVRGDRTDNRLVVTFVLEDADRFHEYLEALNRGDQDGG